MTIDQPTTPTESRSILHAIARVFAGHLHEVNNKLSWILLNAEAVAASSGEMQDQAKEVVDGLGDLVDMTQDLESALPGNVEGDLTLMDLLHLAARLVKGVLRQKRLAFELPELGEVELAKEDHLAAFAIMLLVPLAFPALDEGERGILKVEAFPRDGCRIWRVGLSNGHRCALDPDVLLAISKICQCHDWKMETMAGEISIDARRRR